MRSAMSQAQYMSSGTLHKVKLARLSWNLLQYHFCCGYSVDDLQDGAHEVNIDSMFYCKLSPGEEAEGEGVR